MDAFSEFVLNDLDSITRIEVIFRKGYSEANYDLCPVVLQENIEDKDTIERFKQGLVKSLWRIPRSTVVGASGTIPAGDIAFHLEDGRVVRIYIDGMFVYEANHLVANRAFTSRILAAEVAKLVEKHDLGNLVKLRKDVLSGAKRFNLSK